MKVPVLLLAFNRADHIKQSLSAIKEYKPEKLYLACDGPRPQKKGEKESVEETRRTMLELVDWPCEITTLFQENNLGCAKAVHSAISYFFEKEEWGVIVEDDVVVDLDFFYFCENVLPYYRNEEKVMHINSFFVGPHHDRSNVVVFGAAMRCWGWATWSRAWKKMDMEMCNWSSFKMRNLLSVLGVFGTIVQWNYWRKDYKRIKNNSCSSWATRWNFAVLSNNGICVSPSVVLSRNIGTDCGTHFSKYDSNPYSHLKNGKLELPLVYPNQLIFDKKQIRIDQFNFLRIRLLGLKKIVAKILS